ncbi:lipoprotein NlpI [Photobacterium sp. 1_MG-2023]|uniref:lipoprotein NlpI n=1 Tax=Photobacterium sp. 1_MG-2023 TaxID=3062646 RepID=UPI0026E1B4AB|nr:lipoprotein NlpI [Photobacterium sp. 1_MG-2023]
MALFAKRLKFAVIAMAAMLGGCSTSTYSSWEQPLIAVPLQPSFEQQVQLARIDQLLGRSDLDDETRSQIFYERGLLHDGIGLRDLARLDFERSLKLYPAQPDIFNILGVYLTQRARFDEAYEAFDSALELDVSHPYAQRNRGIALYYGGRYTLAKQDLIAHYEQDPNDPYRTIWLYFVELETAPEKAAQNLTNRFDRAEREDWGWNIVSMLMGSETEQQLLDSIVRSSESNAQMAERLTESYFYMAKRYQHENQYAEAVQLYKLTLSGNVYEFVEHRFAALELNRLLAALQNGTAQVESEDEAL